jgi:MoxR-like ATPase
MNPVITVTQKQLADFLLNVAIVRPVFIWGPPGIGKSSIVHQFSAQLGLPCVSLLGSQLAPEDLIGVPQIVDGKSLFCPPRMIAREEPYFQNHRRSFGLPTPGYRRGRRCR